MNNSLCKTSGEQRGNQKRPQPGNQETRWNNASRAAQLIVTNVADRGRKMKNWI